MPKTHVAATVSKSKKKKAWLTADGAVRRRRNGRRRHKQRQWWLRAGASPLGGRDAMQIACRRIVGLLVGIVARQRAGVVLHHGLHCRLLIVQRFEHLQ